MAKPISDACKKVVDDLVAEYPAKWRGGVCAFGCFNRDTGIKIAGSLSNGACHYEVSLLGNVPAIVVNAHRHQHKNKDFSLWVARESPFAAGVLNRDNEKQILEQASVIDCDIVGHGGALWLCKAFRLFNEDTWKPGYWSQLREHGLDGLQAFIGASILDSQGKLAPNNTHVGLFGAGSPERVRGHYDKAKAWKRLDTSLVAQTGSWGEPIGWGGMKGKKIKKPDGWGGFIEVDAPGGAAEYAAVLKEIFEGDPKNVK